MNKINQITGLICLISIIGWDSGSGKSNHEIINWKSEVEQLISPEDSLIQEKRPTYQELYSKSEQFYDAIGKLGASIEKPNNRKFQIYD